MSLNLSIPGALQSKEDSQQINLSNRPALQDHGLREPFELLP
jgi:hypothetical protein